MDKQRPLSGTCPDLKAQERSVGNDIMLVLRQTGFDAELVAVDAVDAAFADRTRAEWLFAQINRQHDRGPALLLETPAGILTLDQMLAKAFGPDDLTAR